MRTVEPANLDKALDIRKNLVTVVPGEPRFRVSLADLQAASGDYPAAFATLDEAAALGDTGAQRASAARIRHLITLGLLHEASQKLQSKSSREDDFASMLAVAQAWAQLDKHDDARKMASAIPPYAAEFANARVLLAALDTDKGNFASAIKSLTQVAAIGDEQAAIVAPQLFLAQVRAGDAQAALDLALKQKADWSDNTPQSRYWTTLAATAAREGKKYDQAVALLAALDPDSRKNAALDVALMNLLQGKPVDPAALSDNGAAFNASTLALLAGNPAPTPSDRLLAAGLPSAALAVLATTPAPQHSAALQHLARNPRIIPADIQVLLGSLGNDPAPKLRTIALAQRLLEAGWSTTGLDLLNDLDKSTPNIAFVAVQRHQALTDLRRTQDANTLRDAWAARVNDPSFPPSMRVLLAASWSREGQHEKALAVLQPLAPLNRPEILTTLASLHEKLSQLDQAVALHRQVRKLDPENLSAANNLAYTLAAARPTDKAALAEALDSIQFAIARAPRITAFQDTLGWIQILSGNAPEGTRRIARAAPSLRLDPAVHYHLGMGYARLGNKDLARLHLLNVGHLTRDQSNIPETKLATDALTSLASTH
jgi:tetratricopeptide (TPR) repeat protein